MRFFRKRRFVKDYKKLPQSIQKKVDKQLGMMAQKGLDYPGLYLRKMSGVDVWEARVDEHYRMTFLLQDDAIVLRRVGTHEIYRKP